METLKTSLKLKEKVVALSGITTFGVILSMLIGRKLIPQSILTAIIYFLLTGNRPTYVYAQFKTVRRDLLAICKFVYLTIVLFFHEKLNHSAAYLYRKSAEKNPNKVLFMLDDKKLTFQQGEDLSNQIAEYFFKEKYQKKDTIALLMENRVEYPFFWLGLSKIGVISALINTNLRKETLIHSIKVANCKAIITTSDYLDAINEILSDEDVNKLPIYVFRSSSDQDAKFIDGKMVNLKDELDKIPANQISFDISKISVSDKLFYIYTSGTTGLPKAAVITNLRFLFMSVGVLVMMDLRKDDIIYNPLPLYHSAGGVLGVGVAMMGGMSMVIRKKFSASNFWPDCIKYKCTVAQYIGELCRFVYLVPPKPTDSQHSVRMMYGNGLRPQIWSSFATRFKIPHIYEFYGSTEGNSNLINIDNKIGAVGFVPRFAKPIYPVTLVRCDEMTGEPLRNSEGRCEEAQPGEPGVFIGSISRHHAARSFSGYADKKASEKKILKNVFKEGDLYFNSGDLLVSDIYGYYYFKDRTGDTFRWRGENVATSEVESIIMNIAGLNDCVVYGVEIPDVEGKAGMAAIVDSEGKIDFVHLAAGIKANLPAYARPIFIRILPELPMTGTFKLKKRDLQLEGYDITKIKDPIYVLQNDGSYKRLSEKDYDDVKNGRARL